MENQTNTSPKDIQDLPSLPITFIAAYKQSLNKQTHDQECEENSSQKDHQDSISTSLLLQKINSLMKKIYHSNVYKKLYLIIMILYACSIMITTPEKTMKVTIITYQIEIVCHWIFLILFLVRLLACQLNKFSFFQIVSLGSGLALLFQMDLEAQRYLKAIRCLRLFVFLEITSLKEPFSGLVKATKNLPKLMIPAIFLIYIYSIIGLYTFQGNQFYRCRDPANKLKKQNWTLFQDAQYLCGQRKCPEIPNQQLQCLNPIDYGVQPNQKELEKSMFGYGLLRYKNIFYAILNTCKIIFITGWSRIAILEKQVMNQFFVHIYFLSFLYLVSYVYMTVIYGLMMSNENENNQKKVSYIQKHPLERPSIIIAGSQRDQSNQSSMKEKYQDYLLVYEKKRDKSADEEQLNKKNSSKKDYIYLHKHFYLPKDRKLKNCFLVISKIYRIFNSIVVIVGCINLAFEYPNEPYELTRMRGIIDFICFLQLCIHIFILLVILKVKQIYLDEWWEQNKVKRIKSLSQTPFLLQAEIFILFLCMSGIILQIIFADDFERILVPKLKAQKILRLMKYWRIIILFLSCSYFTEVKMIINSTKKAVKQTLPFTAVYFLFVFIFTLVGYNLFYENTTEVKALSFNSVFESFIFVLLTFYNEEWDQNMFNEYPSKGPGIVIFQFLTISIGIIIMSKYYLALLMKYLLDELDQIEYKKCSLIASSNKIKNEFEQNEFDKEQEELQKSSRSKKSYLENEEKTFKQKEKKKRKTKKMQTQYFDDTSENKNRILPLNSLDKNFSSSLVFKKQDKQANSQFLRVDFPSTFAEEKISQIQVPSPMKKSQDSLVDSSEKKSSIENESSMKFSLCLGKNSNEEKQEEEESSKFLKVRIFLQKILNSNIYLGIFIVLIFITLAQVAERDPFLNPKSEKYIVLGSLQKATSVLFLIDLILNLIAFGFFQNSNSYLKKRKTNILNVAVTLLCIPTIFPQISSLYVVSKIGKIKVLRLCMLIDIFCQKNANMRFTIIGFAKLVPKLCKLSGIVCIFYGFFAIFMVKVYSNEFYYCTGFHENATIETVQDCLNWGGSWVQYEFNTNNIFNSLMYLLMIASTQGWVSLMVPMASIREQNLQPKINANGYIRLFFLFFFFFGNMIILNVFIGLSIQSMKEIKQEQSGQSDLTKDEKDWLLIKQKINHIQLQPKNIPQQKTCRYYCYVIANHKAYFRFKIFLIILYLVLMSTTYESPDKTVRIQLTFFPVSLIAFLIEYFGDANKNKKSFFIFHLVFLIYFIIFISLYHIPPYSEDKKLMRIIGAFFMGFQLFRYWTYIYRVAYVRKTLKFLNIIIPHVAYTMALMGVILMLYGYLGVQLFAYLKSNTQISEYDQNYRNFYMAIFSLIKFSTWEAPIEQISNAGMEMKPNFICFQVNTYEDYVQYGANGCGSKVKSYIFFMTFHLIYSIILMSSFIATIFDGYSEVKKQEQELITEFQLEQVTEEWLNYDPEATGFLGYNNFWRFVSKLHQIYQLSEQKIISNESKNSFLSKLNIPIYSDESTLGFQFYETIEALTRVMLNKKYGKQIKTKKPDEIFKLRNSLHRSQYELRNFTSEHVFIIILLRQGLRQWRNKANNVFIPGIFNNVFFKVN